MAVKITVNEGGTIMTIIRKGTFVLAIFVFVLHLVCSLSALDENGSECGTQGAKLSKTQVNPLDLDQGPEIEFVDGVPIFPWARPVVILQGSDFEMGYQYSQQLAQIFAPWILELLEYDFSDGQLRALKGYEWYIKKHAPEMIGFFEGMVQGAKDRGVPLTYDQVLAQFCLGVHKDGYLETPADQTGYPEELEKERPTDILMQNPPHLVLQKSSQKETPSKCGSAAVWGTATKDGKVITSGSSDGDDHFNVTIVCFPEDGNAYIHSPYYAVGPWASAGGHSGMNDKGLVYVHHGVTQTAQAQGKKPRYGIQSDIAIRHTLRYASNAEDAVRMTLSYETTGDFSGGGYYGTGGFWVDKEGSALVIERSDSPAIIRKPGDCGEKDFMYATNTLLSKELGEGGQEYFEHGGWLKKGVAPCRDFSVSRNLFVHNLFSDYHGQIDLEFMKMVWRFRSRPMPVEAHPDVWEKKAMEHYEKDDCEWWATLGHVTNAYVTITVPEDKLYLLSTTYAAKQPTLSHPKAFHGSRWLADATRAFFRLKLGPSPAEVMRAAKYQAEIDLFLAERELRKLGYQSPAYAPLDDIFNRAVIEWTKGDFWRGSDSIGFTLTKKPSKEEAIYYWAKATRAFVRCQLLARKVYNALVPPATKPSELGLNPWKYEPPAKDLPN
jgi:hypothetical protein